MEKKLSIKYQKIIGSPVFPPGVFCGTAVFEREDERSRTHRGKLYALLSISGPKNFDAAISSKIILDCLEEEYFREAEGSPLNALERASVSAGHRLIDLTLGGSQFGSTEFNLVLAVSWGQVLYLSKVGSAAVYLLRGGVVKEIAMGDEARVATASGLVVEGDVLILGTRGFKEAFPPESLISRLPTIEEEISKINERAAISALVLKFDIEEVPSKQEIVRFAQPKDNLQRFVLPSFSHFRLGISSLISSAGALLKARRPRELFLRRPSHSPRLQTKAGLRIALVIFLVLFVGSVVLTLRTQTQRRLDLESQKLLTQAQTNVSAAADLVDLNNSRAKSLLEEALLDISKIERFGRTTENLSSLRDKARQLLSTVTKEKVVSPKLLYDFSLQNKKSSPSSITLALPSDGSTRVLLVSDRDSNNVFKLSLNGSDVSIEKIDDGQVSAPAFLAFYSGTAFGLDKGGVFSISLADLAAKKSLVASTDLGGVKDFKTYLGNLYFLTPSTNGLLKSFVLEGGEYSKPVSWLKEDRDLSNAVSFAVDGSVYVLENTGRILKFEAGKIVEFSLSAFDGTIGPSSAIYTDSLSSLVYVLDAKAVKMIVLSKDGVYQGQYSFGGSGSPVMSEPIFAVDEMAKKAYFLAGAQLLQVDLE